MKRLIASVISVVLLVGGVGLMIANAQQATGPAFIAGDRPVTAEQVLEKLQTTDGRTSASPATAGISKRLAP
jgi:hypothetical protein